jgi:hypothetical protein
MTFSSLKPGVFSAALASWPVFAENLYQCFQHHQSAACRLQSFCAILAGIGVIKARMDSIVESFIYGTQGKALEPARK